MATINEAGHVRQLAEMNRRVVEIEANLSTLQQQDTAAKEAVRRLGNEVASYRFKQLLRSPAESFSLWPLGLMLVGPLVPACLVFLIFASSRWSLAIGIPAAVAAITALILATLLFFPNNTKLAALASEARGRLQVANGNADEVGAALAKTEALLRAETQSRDTVEQSVQYKRERLLQENWKAMRGPEWEAFLADAFHLLGGTILRTGKSGDQGVDLVVSLGQRRYAIQAKGYVSAVGNSAVQEAVAGMAHYRCNCSAVITNSRFTAGAIALAESNCCVLIGEDDIESFVLGRLPL